MPRACHGSLFVLWGERGGLQRRLPLLHGGWLQVSALLAHGSCSKRDGLFVGARARARARYFVCVNARACAGELLPRRRPDLRVRVGLDDDLHGRHQLRGVRPGVSAARVVC